VLSQTCNNNRIESVSQKTSLISEKSIFFEDFSQIEDNRDLSNVDKSIECSQPVNNPPKKALDLTIKKKKGLKRRKSSVALSNAADNSKKRKIIISRDIEINDKEIIDENFRKHSDSNGNTTPKKKKRSKSSSRPNKGKLTRAQWSDN